MKTLILTVDHIQYIAQHVGLDALMDEMILRLEAALLEYDPEQSVIPPRTGFS